MSIKKSHELKRLISEKKRAEERHKDIQFDRQALVDVLEALVARAEKLFEK